MSPGLQGHLMNSQGSNIPHWCWCPKFQSGAKVTVVALGTVLLVAGLVRFANPQWNRWIYVFQAYISPTYEDGIISPPNSFTGTWTMWYRNGQIRERCGYRQGRRHGECVAWSKTGSQQQSQWIYSNGIPLLGSRVYIHQTWKPLREKDYWWGIPITGDTGNLPPVLEGREEK